MRHTNHETFSFFRLCKRYVSVREPHRHSYKKVVDIQYDAICENGEICKKTRQGYKTIHRTVYRTTYKCASDVEWKEIKIDEKMSTNRAFHSQHQNQIYIFGELRVWFLIQRIDLSLACILFSFRQMHLCPDDFFMSFISNVQIPSLLLLQKCKSVFLTLHIFTLTF